MDRPLLSYVAWLELSQTTRNKLTALFNIPRTGESIVHVGQMMNGNIGASQKEDGHKPQDLYAITVEGMQEILGTKEDNFYTLFKNLVENIDDFVETEPASEVAHIMPTSEPVKEEFVPRDPEELIKPKDGKHAKTKKTAAK